MNYQISNNESITIILRRRKALEARRVERARTRRRIKLIVNRIGEILVLPAVFATFWILMAVAKAYAAH